MLFLIMIRGIHQFNSQSYIQRFGAAGLNDSYQAAWVLFTN